MSTIKERIAAAKAERDAALRDLDAPTHEIRGRIAKANLKLKELTREQWPHKCCPCWPTWVGDDGFCGCCEWNHATGERVSFGETEDVAP